MTDEKKNKKGLQGWLLTLVAYGSMGFMIWFAFQVLDNAEAIKNDACTVCMNKTQAVCFFPGEEGRLYSRIDQVDNEIYRGISSSLIGNISSLVS